MPPVPFPPIPHVSGQLYRITVLYNCFGSLAESVFHGIWRLGDPVYTTDPAPLANIVDAWWTAVGPALADCVNTTVQFPQLTIQRIGETPSLALVYVPSTSTEGTVTSGQVGNTTATAVVTWRTNYFGRRGRGRTFVPFLPSTWVKNGVLSVAAPDALTALTAFANALSAPLVSTGERYFQPAVFSPTSSTFNPATHGWAPFAAQDIVSFTVQQRIRIQRRREVGVGM